jgi:hypothetical protein
VGFESDGYDRVAEAMKQPIGPVKKDTCAACGVTGYATEFYSWNNAGTVGRYCRNHNTCQTRRNNNRKEQTMQFGTYEEPVKAEGDSYKTRDNYGHSAIVRVTEYKQSVVTPNSPNGAPAVIVDVYDLNNKAAYRDVLLMTGSLVDAFKTHVAKSPIVIRWEKTVAANGRDYARAVPAVEAAVQAAQAVYANGDPFLTLDTIGGDEEEMPF